MTVATTINPASIFAMDVPDDRMSRSENMRRIRSRDTGPELRIRRALHARGWRYLVCPAGLPGRPDILFRRAKLVVQIHGCFWHQHRGCTRAVIPKSHGEYWDIKLRRNVERDRIVEANLLDQGFAVMTVWECEVKRNCRAVVKNIERAIRRRTRSLPRAH
jgi:DNA mismatch endonuclease (patch repair protein)